jgi:NAD(P)-dependent dehydrogenase (short-subunit alcohol dehydrogenase family)
MPTLSTVQPGEVVVVTGASGGIGRASARAFGARGAHVGLIAGGPTGLAAAARDVEAAGGKACVLPTDVADPDQCEAAAEEVERTFGSIDVWVTSRSRPSLAVLQDHPGRIQASHGGDLPRLRLCDHGRRG